MKKAQSIIEYALIISVVATAILLMNVYVQRSVQAGLRMLQERVNAEPVR